MNSWKELGASIKSTSDNNNLVSPSYEASPLGGPTQHSTPIIGLADVSLATPENAGFDTSSDEHSPSNLPTNDQREDDLLMHYLDVVFALQFRFHQGSRGWLLWLLRQTRPLYHAALSLGALHQYSMLSQTERLERMTELNEFNEHHARAIQELQKFLQTEYHAPKAANRGRRRNLHVLACGVQLISFELFRGGINVWDLHLKYLATSLSQTYVDQESHQPNDSNHTRPTALEHTAEKFLTGAILWFDVIACASTGKGPLMRQSHYFLLQSDHVDLANIVGCHAWVAVLIGEIAQIQEESRDDTLTTWDLVDRGRPIRQQLVTRINALRREIDVAISTHGQMCIILDPIAHADAVRRAVTLVFAYATQVYLNATVAGAFPHDRDIRLSVKDTADALREMRTICDPQASRSLVWPICIAGSMAEDPALQSFFRNLIVELGEQAHYFGNSETVLKVLERCWLYWRNVAPSNTGQGFSWLTAMEEMGTRVLLV